MVKISMTGRLMSSNVKAFLRLLDEVFVSAPHWGVLIEGQPGPDRSQRIEAGQ